jgi:hypothetical protein
VKTRCPFALQAEENKLDYLSGFDKIELGGRG